MLKTVATLCRLHASHFFQPQKVDFGKLNTIRQLHLTRCWSVLDKDHPHKKNAEAVVAEKTGLPPSEEFDEDMQQFFTQSRFPTLETHAMKINGVRFDELHIIHIKATRNNTLLCLTTDKGVVLTRDSGGTVGFRNARKGTNIAAQSAAIALAEKTIQRGINVARVCVKGLGPGRLPSIKALQMSGITIVSITDTTPLPYGNRPKKQRRL